MIEGTDRARLSGVISAKPGLKKFLKTSQSGLLRIDTEVPVLRREQTVLVPRAGSRGWPLRRRDLNAKPGLRFAIAALIRPVETDWSERTTRSWHPTGVGSRLPGANFR